jgi:hypothetical protein
MDIADTQAGCPNATEIRPISVHRSSACPLLTSGHFRRFIGSRRRGTTSTIFKCDIYPFGFPDNNSIRVNFKVVAPLL